MRALAFALLLAPAIASAQVKVVIDAGHGGSDPGGTGTGMQEKVIVLDICKRFETLLDADTADTSGGGKWTALQTRSNDTFVSLAARSAYSNNQGADRFMSVHSNAFSDTSANGTETFSLAATGTGSQLRNLVQDEMLKAWGLTNRGNKTANFAVLRDTAAPAVLHELAFITNPTDAGKLGSAEERQKAAIAHLKAIQRHYNIAPFVPGNVAPQDETGKIAGRVVDSDGAIAGANVMVLDGATVVTDAEGRFVIAEALVGVQSVTASADGYASKTVEITVAASAVAEIEIELTPLGSDGDPADVDGETTGGCSTGRSAGWGILLALVALRRRRRG